MRLARTVTHSLLGLPEAAGHLSALLSTSSACCPLLLQLACSSSRSWGLLPQQISRSKQVSCSSTAGAAFTSVRSSSNALSAPAVQDTPPNTRPAAGPAIGATTAWLPSTLHGVSSRRRAMLLLSRIAISPAWPAPAVLARHVHSSSDPPPATAAGSTESDPAARSLSRPTDTQSDSSDKGCSTGRQGYGYAADGMQPGTPHQQQQETTLQPQQGTEGAADPARELTRSIKGAQTHQQLLQLLQQQQQQQEQQGGVLNAIHVAACYHRLGDMCRADAAVAGTAAAQQLLQHLDQLLPSVQQQQLLGPRELSNIVRACACAQHAAPVPQLLSRFVEHEILTAANSWDVANVLWALGTLEQQLPQQQLLELLAALASKAGTSCQHISNTLWVLVKLGQHVPQQRQVEQKQQQHLVQQQQQQQQQQQLVEQLVAVLVSKADTAAPRDIGTSLWALGKLGHQVPQQQLLMLVAPFTAADMLEQAMTQPIRAVPDNLHSTDWYWGVVYICVLGVQ